LIHAVLELDSSGWGPLAFGRPRAVVEARAADDVLPALRRVEAEALAGRWAVGYVAYEAAPALDAALRVRPGTGPLLWFGIHDAPTDPAPTGPADARLAGLGDDAAAAANVTYIGGHLYGTQPKKYTLALNKGKHVWETEHYYTGDGASSCMSTAKEIFVMDYDGVNPSPLTGNQSINLSPRWSPDGRMIAYTSYRNGNPDLFVLNFDSGRRDVLSAQQGLNATPAWSPDGQWLVFAMSTGGGTNLHLVPKTGGTPKALTTGPAISVSPSFSPNGRQIVFNSDRGGTPQIYVIDVDGSNLRRLTFQGSYNASPRWSPRGEKIVFMCQVAGYQICLINPDGSGLQQVTTAGRNEEPTWSPDGRHIAFTSTRTGQREVFVMHADGSEQKRLTNNGRENYLPDWSP